MVKRNFLKERSSIMSVFVKVKQKLIKQNEDIAKERELVDSEIKTLAERDKEIGKVFHQNANTVKEIDKFIGND